MNKFKKLVSLCKCSVSLTVNNNRDYYETVEQYMDGQKLEVGDVDVEILNKMKELDIIIELQFCPKAPIGFFRLFHYDVDLILDKALSIMGETV